MDTEADDAADEANDAVFDDHQGVEVLKVDDDHAEEADGGYEEGNGGSFEVLGMHDDKLHHVNTSNYIRKVEEVLHMRCSNQHNVKFGVSAKVDITRHFILVFEDDV